MHGFGREIGDAEQALLGPRKQRVARQQVAGERLEMAAAQEAARDEVRSGNGTHV